MTPDWSEKDLSRYVCHRADGPIVIDGRLDEAAWRAAPRSPRFVDMISGRPGFFGTHAAALWDDRNFYVGFWIEEPFVTAALTERDARLARRAQLLAGMVGDRLLRDGHSHRARPRVWIEKLPDSVTAAVDLIGELGR